MFHHEDSENTKFHGESMCIPCLRGYLIFVGKTLFKTALFEVSRIIKQKANVQ